MRLRCCLGVAYFLAKSEPVLLIKVLLIKKACRPLKSKHVMMTGLHDCTRCGKKLTSRQSLWNHNRRCKLNGKGEPGLMYDYDTKPKLHDLGIWN